MSILNTPIPAASFYVRDFDLAGEDRDLGLVVEVMTEVAVEVVMEVVVEIMKEMITEVMMKVVTSCWSSYSGTYGKTGRLASPQCRFSSCSSYSCSCSCCSLCSCSCSCWVSPCLPLHSCPPCPPSPSHRQSPPRDSGISCRPAF